MVYPVDIIRRSEPRMAKSRGERCPSSARAKHMFGKIQSDWLIKTSNARMYEIFVLQESKISFACWCFAIDISHSKNENKAGTQKAVFYMNKPPLYSFGVVNY